MSPRCLAFLSCICTASASPTTGWAAEKEPVVLKRDGSWRVNYDKDSCTVLAGFGTGGQQIQLHLTRLQPSDSFRITLVGEPIRRTDPFGRATLDFGPAVDPQRVDTISGEMDGKPMAVVTGGYRFDDQQKKNDASSLPPIAPETEATVTYLDLKVSSGSYRLALGRMDRVMAVMRQCTDDLVQSWGFDPAVQRSLSRRVESINSPNSWVVSADYPRQDLNNGNMALVDFRLNVDAAGGATGCRIQRSTQGDAFQQTTCKNILARARFRPALDAEGKPIASYYANTVLFIIP